MTAGGAPAGEQAEFGIVVPTFNSGATLWATLMSVITQEGDQPVHLHVQDGGSNDHTLDIVRRCQELVSEDSRVTLTVASKTDSGVPEALNRGFRAVSGRILGWLGSDDLLLPGALSSISSFMPQHEANWVTGLHTVVDENGIPVALRGHSGIHRYPTGYSRVLLARGFHSNGWVGGIQQEGTFWTRSLWEKAGRRIDESLRLAFDFELWCRFAQHSELVQLVAPLAAFRIRSGQLSEDAAGYRSELKAVRTSLRKSANEPAKLLDTTHWGRPVASYSQHQKTWVLKRHLFGGRPFSRLGEKLMSRLKRG